MQELVGEGAGGVENVLGGEKSTTMVWLLSLLGLSVVLPFFNLQLVTGPLINAILFIATVVLGWKKTLWICLFPSVIAFSVGLLPAILGPMIPFIMIGNMILVVVFNPLWRKNWWLGVGAASFLKFLFLFGMSRLLFGLILRQSLPAAVADTLAWPQLYSALIGGVLAYLFLKFVKRI